MFGNYKDTIQVLASKNNYTLIEYVKGDRDEWCVCLNYNPETRSWDSGTYAYSLEDAFYRYLQKQNDVRLKSKYQLEIEGEHSISYERMVELATKFKDGLIEDDEDSAMEYFDDECEMTDDEKKFFGVYKQKYKLVKVTLRREQKATITIVMPNDEDKWSAYDYIGEYANIEPDEDGEWEAEYSEEEDEDLTREDILAYDQEDIWNYCDVYENRM